jgi:hypothetical protein
MRASWTKKACEGQGRKTGNNFITASKPFLIDYRWDSRWLVI